MTRPRQHLEEPYTGDTVPLAATPPLTASHPQPARPASRRASGGRGPALRGSRPGRSLELRRVLRRLRIGALLCLLLACAGLLVVQQRVARAVALRDVRSNRPVAKLLVTPMNILLLGVDSRPDHPEEGMRSDSLLLLHLDPAGGWANLLAIPRDSLATVPGFGDQKINAAFARGYNHAAELYGDGTQPTAGGAALAAETVEQFLGFRELGTRVDYFATVDFDGFAAMIDALGGIEVDVPHRIVDDAYPTPYFGTMRIEFEAGPQRLNGERALQYVRTRHADSDFGRAQRQQQVLRAMAAALRAKPLPLRPLSALRLLNAAGDALRTTMPVGRLDALVLGLLMSRVDPAELGHYRIDPDSATLLTEQSTDLVWDPASVRQLARQAFTPPSEAKEHAVIQVVNGAGVDGLAASVSETLAAAGFTRTEPDTVEPSSRSLILDFTGKPQTRRRLQQLLRGIPVEERPASTAPPGVDILVVLGDDYERFMPRR